MDSERTTLLIFVAFVVGIPLTAFLLYQFAKVCGAGWERGRQIMREDEKENPR